MAAKFFTGLPLDGPDPECVKGNSDGAGRRRVRPGAGQDHSHTGPVRNQPVPLTLLTPARPAPATPARCCRRWPATRLRR